MKPSAWFLGGLASAVLAGLSFLGLGFLRPGPISVLENTGISGRPLLAEAKKKTESIRQAQEKMAATMKGWTGLKGNEGEHRVFVSAQLVYLPENPEPVQPLDPKMVTKDGIEVGWKKNYRFDPADPGISDGDPDGDGFTNLEEFLAKTDPTRKEDSPAKESKLKSRSGEPVALAVSFPEKSGGSYSVRFQVGTKRREFKGKPGDSFWLMASSDAVEIFTEKDKLDLARAKAKESAKNSHAIPLQFASYQEKVEKIKDERAGGVEVEVDNSMVILERKDALEGTHQLVFSTPQRPRILFWDVGDIRFFTPASGGVEIGPYRVGEIFLFEGKEFAVLDRTGAKIKLQNRTDPGKDPFWVAPEPTPVVPSPN
jgi:hypothetical protein